MEMLELASLISVGIMDTSKGQVLNHGDKVKAVTTVSHGA